MPIIPLNLTESIVATIRGDEENDLGTAKVLSAWLDTDAPSDEQLNYLIGFEKGSPPIQINQTDLASPPD